VLTTLNVRNLALAEDVRVEFGPGLNIVTGETGAGKSILLGALALLLGERADRGAIRTGAEQGLAEAVFELAAPEEVNALLTELGLPPCEDGQLLLRRVVKAGGAGQQTVNDAPVTLQALKRLGELLVDMHGPHDHQSLLRNEAQLDILDAFAHLAEARAPCADAHAAARATEARRAELLAGGDDIEAQMDLLAYRIKEIEDAQPAEGEEEKIRAEHEVIGHAQRIVELANPVVGALTEDDASACARLAGCRPALEELARLLPAAADWPAEAERLALGLRAFAAGIGREVERIETDPARLDWLDQRLALYRKIRRKYGETVAEILEKLAADRRRLDDLRHRTERLQQIEVELDRQRAELHRAAQGLRRRRLKAAGQLAEAITAELRALGFPHGAFTVALEEMEPGPSGMDRAEFGFAPNVGETVRPLRQIASSGEISRVMLAVKTVLARHDRIPVLVFDEIDANLGGEMGGAVGAKLAAVASARQVIAITHLPQVAVYGARQLAVRKEVSDGRTYSRALPVSGPEREKEIARMLGGADAEVALQHARSMLRRAGTATGRR